MRRAGATGRGAAAAPTNRRRGEEPVRRRTVAGVTAALGLGAWAAVQVADAAIRRHEHLDPDAIERPGAVFYLRGVGMHFVERGHGAAVLLVHGVISSTFSFRYQIESLAPHFRVLAVDLPGFGYSDRPTDVDLSHTAHAERLREFLDRMGIERATVIGHSMGGAVAMRLAAAYPERVEKLVLVSSAAPDQRYNRMLLYALVRPLLPVPTALLLGRRGWRRRIARRKTVYDPALMTDEVMEGYNRPLRLRGTTASLLKMMDDVRHDAPLDPATVSTPALLLWGEADRVVPLAVGHRLDATMPHARLEVVPRAGHLVLEEQPDACDQAILRFLGAPVAAVTP